MSREPPRIVGTPPADAGRGLVRVSADEIRHYGGNESTTYLVSLDNGETWAERTLPASFPKQHGGLWKEAHGPGTRTTGA